MPNIKSSDDSSFLSEINMIPMIDVALVLLIIFMIITPQMILNSIQVMLPKSSSEKTPPAKVLTIAIKASGEIFLNNEPVQPGTLSDRIKAISPEKLEGALIFSDRDAAVSNVVEVIDQIETAGVHNINLSTQRKTQQP